MNDDDRRTAALYAEVADKVDAEAERFAKAALGIPDAAHFLSLDMSKAALFVYVGDDGVARAHARIPKKTAAWALRELAKQWEAEAAGE